MKVFAVVTDYSGYGACVEKLFFSKEDADEYREFCQNEYQSMFFEVVEMTVEGNQ